MKALTILQPFASLIITPQSELPSDQIQKRVENRTRNMRYRGPLLIHAGKSTRMMDAAYRQIVTPASYGAILGVVEVVDCLRWETGNIFTHPNNRHCWMMSHPHAHGPFCIVLDNPRRFSTPIPWKGRQGLFDVPDEIVESELLTWQKQLSHIPNGSDRSILLGCTCPLIDNGRGFGSGRVDDDGKPLFWITQGCPLHWKERSVAEDNWYSVPEDILRKQTSEACAQREQWNADNMPYRESLDEHAQMIGTFIIEGRVFFAIKKPNGYNPIELMEIPGPVMAAIDAIFRGAP